MNDYEENLNNEETEETVAGESKADKFKRLGTARTNKVISGLEGLAHLANKSNYEYTEEQIDAIFGAIEGTLAEVKEKFKATKSGKKTFSL